MMKNLLLTMIIAAAGIMTLQAQESKSLLTNSDGDLNIEVIQHHGTYHLNKGHAYMAEQFNIDPGIAPEGDYMGNCSFTPDGNSVLLTSRITNIVTIYDWASMDVLANVGVGEYPSCVGANNDFAVIGCQFSDSIYFIDLFDYSIAAVLPTDEQPCSIEISPDGNIAYVACDIDNTCMAFDMASQSYIGKIDNFPVYLNTFSWAAQVNRGWEKYNGFVVLPAGNRIAIANPDGSVDIFSTNTYVLVGSIAINGPRAVAVSGNGNYLLCASNPDNQCTVYQIDLATYQITDSVEITGYGLGTNAIVANQDGSKAYIGTTNNTSTLVRFETEDFVTFNSTYTAFWLGVSYDHLYAVSGQNRFSIVNFDTEQIEDQYTGLNQSFGAVSPVNYHVFGYDPLRYEGAYFFDFTTPDDIDYRGTMLAGEQPEGDTPGAVAINNDRTRALAAGNLSYNVPVINLGSMEAITAVPVEESCYDVAITPDGQWAVAGGYDNNRVKIIDMSDNSLATTVITGQRPMIVEMAPDGQHAYIGNIKQNSLTMLEMDGPNSNVLVSVPCGIIGVYTPFFGIRSAVTVSPDGGTVLVTASFDDELKVFDTQTRQIVASLPTGDFPLDAAIDGESKTACIVNTFDASYDIVSIDGENSTVTYHNTLNADYPMDVAYNVIEDLFYICSANSKKIFKIDPASGDVVETINTEGSPFHIEFYSGIPVIQIQGNDNVDHKIIYGETEFILPYSAAPFTLNEVAGMVGVPIPGPDLVSIIDLGPPPYINENSGNDWLRIYPNPASEILFISSEKDFEKLQIFDSKGQLMIQKNASCSSVNISSLPAGTYVISLSNKSLVMSKIFVAE
ncbi:MAG: beta-propeller fold lactonase family protein [Bacteroidales bacterium]|nr:beta-propeller fold lactonase family protein [Bacteroidales bacterium]